MLYIHKDVPKYWRDSKYYKKRRKLIERCKKDEYLNILLYKNYTYEIQRLLDFYHFK